MNRKPFSLDIKENNPELPITNRKKRPSGATINIGLNNSAKVLTKLINAIRVRKVLIKDAWAPHIFLFPRTTLESIMLLLKYFFAIERKPGKWWPTRTFL